MDVCIKRTNIFLVILYKINIQFQKPMFSDVLLIDKKKKSSLYSLYYFKLIANYIKKKTINKLFSVRP